MHAPMHARTDGRTTRKHNTAAGNIKKLVALLVGNYFTKTAHPSPQPKRCLDRFAGGSLASSPPTSSA